MASSVTSGQRSVHGKVTISWRWSSAYVAVQADVGVTVPVTVAALESGSLQAELVGCSRVSLSVHLTQAVLSLPL